MNTILATIMSLLAFLFPMAPGLSSGSSELVAKSSYGAEYERHDIVESDPATLIDAQQIGWESYEVIDADTIRVIFWDGPTSCHGFYTGVEETAQSVTVRVFSGVRRDVHQCDQPLIHHSVVVDLESPLMGRQVLGLRAE